MIWTKSMFDTEISVLIDDIQATTTDEEMLQFLTKWERRNRPMGVYGSSSETMTELVTSFTRVDHHPSSTWNHPDGPRSVANNEFSTASNNGNQNDEVILMEDPTIADDEDRTQISPIMPSIESGIGEVLSGDTDKLETIQQGNNPQNNYTRWYLSIVYNDTYQCPVLYFRVEVVENTHQAGGDGEDGRMMISRQQVVELLQGQHHQNDVPDTWEFVSLEEHPIHQIPYFLFHPCQTQERMKLLFPPPEPTVLTTRSTAISERDSETNNNSRRPPIPKGLALLSWMSMILPAIGMKMPSRVFESIRHQLLLKTAEESATA